MKRREFLRGLVILPAVIRGIPLSRNDSIETSLPDHDLLSENHPDIVNIFDIRKARVPETLAVLDEDGDLWIDPDWNMTRGASATLRPFGDDDTYFTLEKGNI